MRIAANASVDDNTYGGEGIHPDVGFAPDVLPEKEVSQKGVSTHCAPGTTSPALPSSGSIPRGSWYVLRATYGREKQACDYMKAHGIRVFHPTQTVHRKEEGKIKAYEESCIPNIFFAFGTKETIESFVYDNTRLSYLRFYSRCCRSEGRCLREPLIIPTRQMEDFIHICSQRMEQDVIVTTRTVQQFANGQMVRVVKGPFEGVEGRIARYKRQQRVAVVIEGVATVITAYVPTAYVEPLPVLR